MVKHSGQILGQNTDTQPLGREPCIGPQSGPWDNLDERTLGVSGSILHYIEAEIGSESRALAKGQR